MKTVSTFQWWACQFSLTHSNKGFPSSRTVLLEAQQFGDKHGAVSTLGSSWAFPMSEDRQVRQSLKQNGKHLQNEGPKHLKEKILYP